jgi:hypothetical protein
MIHVPQCSPTGTRLLLREMQVLQGSRLDVLEALAEDVLKLDTGGRDKASTEPDQATPSAGAAAAGPSTAPATEPAQDAIRVEGLASQVHPSSTGTRS